MVCLPISGVRRACAGLLIFVLTLTGIGRAVATPQQLAVALDAIAGFHVPICHAAADGPAEHPVQPSGHDCCDACALLGAILLPDPPALSGPAPVSHVAAHARVVAWVPALARTRSPRQSRGPPAA